MKKLLFIPLVLCAFAFAASGQTVKLSKEEIARRVQAATPAAFTGAKVKRPMSDAAHEGLKGKVRSVAEYIAENGRPSELVQEMFFDEDGYLSRTVDHRAGLPTYVSVYGWLNGKRVARYGEVKYGPGEGGGAPTVVMSVADAAALKAASPDVGYNMELAYKYDSAGRLIQERRFNSAGRYMVGIDHTYGKFSRIERDVNENGGDIARSDFTIDDAGNTTRRVMYDEAGDPNYAETYTYDLDKRGNWTKRTTYGEELLDPSRKQVLQSVTTRAIVYY